VGDRRTGDGRRHPTEAALHRRGKTHPKVKEYEGDVYRDMLMQRAKDRRVDVVFDDKYRTVPALSQLISESTMVILPYDSPTR